MTHCKNRCLRGRSHSQPRGAGSQIATLEMWLPSGVYMSIKSKVLAVVVCSFVLAICPLVYGQANGSFSGTVQDKTGSVITGATVKITSQETGAVREAKSDASGYYLVPLLPVGNY